MKPLRPAFTLIELLIVVAIIAILAAIAVPNFLEAQTRSKVSRVKADMRTLATAIEAYRVDGNKYPPDVDDGIAPANHPQFLSYLPRLTVLTTPVSFLTSIPEDVFAPPAVSRNATLATPYRVPYGSGPLVRPFPFDYAYRNQNPPNSLQVQNSIATWSRITDQPEAVLWALRSVGPDLEATTLGSTVTVYDPTNGTVSRGDIFYCGPGKGFGAPKNP